MKKIYQSLLDPNLFEYLELFTDGIAEYTYPSY